MIDDLDEVLRQLLIRELPIKNGEIDIKFDQPKREWSSRLSRPTLNLFLHEIAENKKLRQTRPMWEVERHNDGTVTKRLKPVRVDLRYIITAWANEPEDEHRLLTRTLFTLFRHPNLPEELLPESLQNQPVPIPVKVAQEEELRNPADLWSAMDNEMRPSISCLLTVAMDPYRPITGPLVRTRELRIGPSAMPRWLVLDETTEPDQFWTIGGTVQSDRPLDTLQLILVEQGRTISIQPEGRFSIGNLKAGQYTLEISANGRQLQRQEITVPSPDYDLKV